MKTILILILAFSAAVSNPAEKSYLDLSLPWLGKKGEHKFSDSKDKLMVIDFWATWCPPCRESLPHLEKIQKEHPEIEVWAINLDAKPKQAEKFLQQHQLDLRAVFDKGKEAAKLFKVSGMPSMFLVAGGKVLWSKHGYTTGDMQELKKKIGVYTQGNANEK